MVQKKTLVKNSVRVMKTDVGPLSPIRRDEIVEEIVDHLRPWRDRKGAVAVTCAVNQALDAHRKFALRQTAVSNRKQIRDHAKQFDRALIKFETLLHLAPDALTWLLYYPSPPMKTTLPKRAEDIERLIRKRADYFAAELKQMRRQCARAVDPGFGPHPNYNNSKHTCAWGAHGLMEGLSDSKISGTKDGAFRAIASLLYEVVSGKQNADLKRACDSVLRQIKDLN